MWMAINYLACFALLLELVHRVPLEAPGQRWLEHPEQVQRQPDHKAGPAE